MESTPPATRQPAADDPRGAPEAPDGPRFRKSHPYSAFLWMVLPMLAAPLVIFIPFLGWVLLLVLLPIEFGRIGGRRIGRPDALWVAVPAAFTVSLYELGLVWAVLEIVPGFNVGLDLLGVLIALMVFGFNGFFYSVGALSTSFDPAEPVPAEVLRAAAP